MKSPHSLDSMIQRRNQMDEQLVQALEFHRKEKAHHLQEATKHQEAEERIVAALQPDAKTQALLTPSSAAITSPQPQAVATKASALPGSTAIALANRDGGVRRKPGQRKDRAKVTKGSTTASSIVRVAKPTKTMPSRETKAKAQAQITGTQETAKRAKMASPKSKGPKVHRKKRIMPPPVPQSSKSAPATSHPAPTTSPLLSIDSLVGSPAEETAAMNPGK